MTASTFPWRMCPALLLFAFCAFSRADERPLPGAAYKPPPDFAAKAAEYMQARVRVTGFSGAVLVAYDGRPLFRQGYGFANHEFNISNTPKTKFRPGSVTKQFTAAGILLLEQRGKLK